MKRVMRNSFMSLLGATMGMYLMVAPIATTVYAAEDPAAVSKDIANDQHADKDRGNTNDQHADKDRGNTNDQHADKDRRNTNDQHVDKDRRNTNDQHHDMFSNHGPRGKHDRFSRRDMAERMEKYLEYLAQNQISNIGNSPVEVVMTAANIFGFDVNNDIFTLVSQSNTEAVVQVTHDGIVYSLTLVPSFNGSWQITAMD